MKRCSKCGATKTLDEFHRQTRSPDGRQARCKACSAAYHVQLTARRAAANPDHVRETWLRLRYAMTPAQFDARLASQGGVCAVCRKSAVRWHVDHDHACCPGVTACAACVRGILCPGCNQGLGNFQDTPEALRAAATYVESFR